MDTVVNSQGKCLIQSCRMCNLCILNGHIGSDKGLDLYNISYMYNGAKLC